MTKAGLEEFRRLQVHAEDTSQRRAPMTSAPKYGVAATRTRLTIKTTSATLRISRGDRNEVTISTADGGNEKQHLAIDEVERVKAEARGDRRAGGEAQHDAAEHQCAERRQCQAVDRPPPFADQRRLRARSQSRSPLPASLAEIPA